MTVEFLIFIFIIFFFNAMWSIIFFGFHQIELALLNILIILIFIIILMKLYFKRDKISFYLTIPYILWVSYAFILNLSIVILNN